jgi:hypothetical protein
VLRPVNSTESLGSFNVSPGAALAFTGGTHHIDTGTSLGGAGRYVLSGGALNIDAAVTAPQNFVLAGGTLSGTGTFTVTGTTMNWTAAPITCRTWAPTGTSTPSTTPPA